MSLEKIIVANPRGFCAGVVRAIDVVNMALTKYGKTYVYHPIVHNEEVVKSLREKGAIFVEDIDEIPHGERVIFSAHGISPYIKKLAEKRNLKCIDATCPLVNKVHLEASLYHEKGYEIILIGHKGHQEVVGTMGVAPMRLVEKLEDVNNLNIDNNKIVYITQTTLSIDDTKEITEALKQRFPYIESPKKDDICYATQNRQDAIKLLSEESELILVVGSRTSSNSNRLVETAEKMNTLAYLIMEKEEIVPSWLSKIKTVGITAGASTPESLVENVIWELSKYGDTKIEYLTVTEENIKFPLPKLL